MTKYGSVLFIDAYDSFAENIAALLRHELSVELALIRIDCDVQAQFGKDIEEFVSSFDAIVLGPGPGNPQNISDVGLFNQVWEVAALKNIPVLGICLGFQSLCVRYGLPVIHMDLPCHGHAKQILHLGQDIFKNSGEVVATNYNSLGCRLKEVVLDPSFSRTNSSGSVSSLSSSLSVRSHTSLPYRQLPTYQQYGDKEDLLVLAWDKDDWLMAAKHKVLPFYGFQFHPESCKSNSSCTKLIKQWWNTAQTHNSLFRPPRTDEIPRTLLAASNPTVESNTEALSMFQDRLADLTQSCGSVSHLQKISSSGGSKNIAQLCYEAAPKDVLMLESTRKGRYSIYAFPGSFSFRIEYAAGCCTLTQDSNVIENIALERAEMIRVLENFMSSKATKLDDLDLPFRGGLMGYLSYEFGTSSLALDVPQINATETAVPEISLIWIDRSIIFDHDTLTVHIQSIREHDAHWVQDMISKIGDLDRLKPMTIDAKEAERLRDIQKSAVFSLPDHDKYISKIQQCQSELRAGNSYELCLTTEAEVFTPTGANNSWLLYRNIQRHNPVPFAAFIRLNTITILSSSPEQFLSWSTDRTIDMVPMKGTVKKKPEMTLERATAILASAKESAENLMIADLIRHDLYSTVGRDALVEVVKLCHVIETETVFTLVSHIRAHAPSKNDSNVASKEMTENGIKALACTLPPGSMTGAPKKRSCEILHGLERRNRGVYSGAIGYMDISGRGAWSVCIRTAFANDDDIMDMKGVEMQKWRIGAGGAITVLSDEEQEWEEMMTKLDSVLRAFQHS
ncbi:aminodeoxychorismate synthase [Exophiala aquamarina CBS 119918]|uniref:aminodeoxychorismate synthase n=1 Tax=Exophiala aquamarina CBS 119918 TaxID=1182545 RepID=A0A072PLZ7_9EURO|nr:aminodeoxychorismate synthase [Exophiala aquamarina CBS 119918]KEF60343.1 aminodeoxychorismate synthase [Exophiala aquamarina CBS 119918]